MKEQDTNQLEQAFLSGNEQKAFQLMQKMTSSRVKELSEHSTVIKKNLSNMLISAAASGDQIKVQFLIDRGADVNVADKDGITALMWAIEKGTTGTIKVLVKHRADLNAEDQKGNTALMWALKNARHEVASFLVANGANPNIHNKDGENPLMWAVKHSEPYMVKLLVSKTNNHQDRYKALEYAIKYNKKSSFEVVLINLFASNVPNNIESASQFMSKFSSIYSRVLIKSPHLYQSFLSCKNLLPLLSKDEIDSEDIDILKKNFIQLSYDGQKQYIEDLKSELLKHLAQKIMKEQAHALNKEKDRPDLSKLEENIKNIASLDELKNSLTESKKLTEQEKSKLLQTACESGNLEAAKLLLESKADYSKLDLSKTGPKMKKFLKSYGINMKKANFVKSEVVENISSLNIEQLRKMFNSHDPNKYKDQINAALDNQEGLTQEAKKEFILFLCKKGFDPKNFVHDVQIASAVLVDEDKIKQTIKIIDEVISKTGANAKVDSEKIYKKMQEAKLIPDKTTAEQKGKIIKKINKITAEYNHTNRSQNFIKRAAMALLHFVGVKYVGQKEAISLLSKIHLPSSNTRNESKER